MRQKQILDEVKGSINRHDLYYWEKKGYINPKRIASGRIERLEYSEKDAKIIRIMADLYGKGLPPKLAYQQAQSIMRSEKSNVDAERIGTMYTAQVDEEEKKESSRSSEGQPLTYSAPAPILELLNKYDSYPPLKRKRLESLIRHILKHVDETE